MIPPAATRVRTAAKAALVAAAVGVVLVVGPVAFGFEFGILSATFAMLVLTMAVFWVVQRWTPKPDAPKTEQLLAVHHHTGNALQMMSSIMSMKRRLVATDAEREILSRMQERVRSLADIQDAVFRTDLSQTVALADVLPEVIDRMEMVDGRAVELDLETMELPADQAVATSLFVTEVLRVLAGGDHRRACRVIARAEGERCTITVQVNGAGVPVTSVPKRLDLIDVYAEQLDGEIDRHGGPQALILSLGFRRKA